MYEARSLTVLWPGCLVSWMELGARIESGNSYAGDQDTDLGGEAWEVGREPMAANGILYQERPSMDIVRGLGLSLVPVFGSLGLLGAEG